MTDTTGPTDHDPADEQPGGQVSEVGRLDPADADTPISDDQSVAGQPDGESGETDEGPTGPNARVNDPSGRG